jgi:hypothetical protein
LGAAPAGPAAPPAAPNAAAEAAVVAAANVEIVPPVEVPDEEAPPANNVVVPVAEVAPPQNWAAQFNAANFGIGPDMEWFNENNNAQQGGRRRTRGRRKSAMKKRLRTQRNSRK